MSKQLYAVNKTESNLQLNRGFFHIRQNGYKAVSDAEMGHPDFGYAKERGWIEITDEKPEDRPILGGVKAIEALTPYQGMTLEQLRESEKDEDAIKPKATSSSIGKPSEEEAPIVVETAEPVSEGTTKAKKKAADKVAEKAGE